MNKRYYSQWQKKYQELQAYQVEHGHVNVPRSDGSLGNWVNNQRKAYKKAKLDSDRIKLLEWLGFVWNPYEQQWQGQYLALQTYKAKRGHCNVSQGDKENKVLGNWVGKQRASYKKGRIEQDKINLLEELGFVWDIDDKKWREKYQLLRVYQVQNGHCDVPQMDGSLGMWVSNQRQRNTNFLLRQDRIKMLKQAGFRFRISW